MATPLGDDDTDAADRIVDTSPPGTISTNTGADMVSQHEPTAAGNQHRSPSDGSDAAAAAALGMWASPRGQCVWSSRLSLVTATSMNLLGKLF